jgi:hypothetical protein
MAMNDDLLDAATSTRRAAILYWILGGVILFIGLTLMASAAALPQLEQDARVKEMVDELRKQVQFDPAILFAVYGGVLASYGAFVAILAFFVWRAFRVALIIGLTLCLLVGVIVLLMTLASVLTGNPGNILPPLLVLIAHAWLIKWQIAALKGSPAATATFAPPPAYVPMGAYYLPPLPPVRP